MAVLDCWTDNMAYRVFSDRLRGTFTYRTITDARKRAYQMLSEHPRTDAGVYIDGKDNEYLKWTVMHCGKRFITRFMHLDDHRIVRKDGTLGIHIKAQKVYDGRHLIGYRFYGGDEPRSGVVVDAFGKVIRRK